MYKPFLSALSAVAAVAITSAASAAPVIPASAPQVNVIPVAGGCARGWHPNRWHHCTPNHYAYRFAPYRDGFYGGGYQPLNRPSPSDRVADELNRRELYHGGWGY